MTDLTPVQEKLTAIATAHTDFAKASFEANKAYFEKLVAVKAPDQALQVTAEHVKSAYETFVAESKKFADLYKNFFETAFTPKSA